MISYPSFEGDQLCAQIGDELFFIEDGANAYAAEPALRRLCMQCRYQPECAEWAIKHERFGFWGGLSARQRAMERRRRGLFVDAPEVVAS